MHRVSADALYTDDMGKISHDLREKSQKNRQEWLAMPSKEHQ